jgi:hypothetical protein
MGACECENPMEFGYELNALEKDEQQTKKNELNENNMNTSQNNNEKNYVNTMPNIVSSDNNREKENLQNKINQLNINNSQDNQNYSEGQFIEEEKNPEGEGLNALRARYENENNQNDEIYQSDDNKQFLFKNNLDEPQDDFSKYIFDNLNNIRENPQSFIPIIERAKSNIMYDKSGICIYKSSVKVALSKGEPAFDEAIEYLKNLKPMQKLKFSSDLLIPLPENEEQIKDRTYMNELINKKVQSGIPIKSFWRDIINNRETCLLLMVVDETGPNSGRKRSDILDENMQYIGITSKKIGKNFASYMALC